MASNPHANTLKSRHDELDEKISDLAASPSSDDLEITRLKREKLHLKDQIEALD